MTGFPRFNGPVERVNKDVSDILEGLKREFTLATFDKGRLPDEVVEFGFKLSEGFREVISRIVKLEEEIS